jgi:hypothetical protein
MHGEFAIYQPKQSEMLGSVFGMKFHTCYRLYETEDTIPIIKTDTLHNIGFLCFNLEYIRLLRYVFSYITVTHRLGNFDISVKIVKTGYNKWSEKIITFNIHFQSETINIKEMRRFNRFIARFNMLRTSETVFSKNLYINFLSTSKLKSVSIINPFTFHTHKHPEFISTVSFRLADITIPVIKDLLRENKK